MLTRSDANETQVRVISGACEFLGLMVNVVLHSFSQDSSYVNNSFSLIFPPERRLFTVLHPATAPASNRWLASHSRLASCIIPSARPHFTCTRNSATNVGLMNVRHLHLLFTSSRRSPVLHANTLVLILKLKINGLLCGIFFIYLVLGST